ncbi:hypothetical protein BGZ96_005038 [Linnemannia gamsii]|uniref:Uncharacterized protein n=1 Tax=Linnemannia gamsii TaxID=64522 RepID=A0ABQ7K4T2_9FUNG|nr:hypothetical protein BGZ96_005038 [Linnemannia gamsii]
MIQQCPHLDSLTVGPVEAFGGSFGNLPFSLRLILVLPNLQELRITRLPRGNEVEDLVEILSSLPQLRTLEYYVSHLKDFQFLVPSLLPHQQRLTPPLLLPISQEHGQEEVEEEANQHELPLLAIPALEHITIKNVYINVGEEGEFDRLVLDFLKTRPLLKHST